MGVPKREMSKLSPRDAEMEDELQRVLRTARRLRAHSEGTMPRADRRLHNKLVHVYLRMLNRYTAYAQKHEDYKPPTWDSLDAKGVSPLRAEDAISDAMALDSHLHHEVARLRSEEKKQIERVKKAEAATLADRAKAGRP